MRPSRSPGRHAAAVILALLVGATATASVQAAGTEGGTPLTLAPDLPQRLKKFAPTMVEADLSRLSLSEREVLRRIVAASAFIDEVFLRQAWADNAALRDRLRAAPDELGRLSPDDLGRAALDYFGLSYGPWDRLDESPFVGNAPRAAGAGFYPPDMTKEEFEAWIRQHPGDEKAFKSLTTVIRRQGGKLVAVPYSVEYREWLEPAARELESAAAATENATLRRYLTLVAAAFRTDDYYPSDVAWMDLDSRVEVTIGPYETYEDRLFGYKASFESFVTLVDEEQSAKLGRYKAELPALERNLPIPEEHKNLSRGAESPIRVVDEAFAAGDTRAGVQTIAFNLPNDEKVREAKGSKKVLLRNVMNAKFRQILKPIAERVLDAEQLKLLSEEAFFNETLFHELSHGLGPGRIKVDGRDTEARLELKELYSAVEEAKADVMGVWNILYLIQRGMFPESFRQPLFATYVAGVFRSTRFGVAEAHGQGTAMQFNYLRERGAVSVDEAAGKVRVDFTKIEAGIRDLVHDLCMLQAKGDYAGTKALLDRYGVMTPALAAPLARLDGIPVDIRPIYPAAAPQ
jgi:hypothetical protein